METMELRTKKRPWQTALCLALTLMVQTAAGFLLFTNLGEFRIADYDEARHGVNAYEMIRNEDYLVHTYQGETDLWNLKPPMSFWSIVLGYRLFGYNTFGLRFFSALSVLLSLTALTVWAWRRLGQLPALALAMAFAFNAGLYGNHFARFADADALYQLFFTLAMISMLLSRKKLLWYAGSALCFALAFLTKATHAATIPVICLLFFLLMRQWRQLNWKNGLTIVACGLAPIAAWALARYSRDGMAFFEGMLQTDVVSRMGGAASGADAELPAFWYYIKTIVERPSLAVGLMVSALCGLYCLAAHVKLPTEARWAAVGSLLWLLVPIVLYSLTGSKFKWYVYSGFMAVPVLAASMVCGALQGKKQAWLPKTVLCLGAAAVLFFGWQIWGTVEGITFDHAYQEVLREYLDRDSDSGLHIYVQYNEGEEGSRLTQWQQGDLLEAELDGDVICLDGGMEAFVEDEDWALLLIGREGNLNEIDELSALYIPRCDGGSVYLYEN